MKIVKQSRFNAEIHIFLDSMIHEYITDYLTDMALMNEVWANLIYHYIHDLWGTKCDGLSCEEKILRIIYKSLKKSL